MATRKQIIDLQSWWIGEIRKITEKVNTAEEKRQEKARKKNFDALADYRNENEILDAYGFGFITGKQKDHLLDLMQKREAMEGDDPLYRLKLELLSEEYQTARRVIENNTQEIAGEKYFLE